MGQITWQTAYDKRTMYVRILNAIPFGGAVESSSWAKRICFHHAKVRTIAKWDMLMCFFAGHA